MKLDIVESVDVSSDHLLVRELAHRVTNEFASVIGLVSLIAARSTNDDVKDSLSCVMDNGSTRGCPAPGEGLKIVEALAKELDGEITHRFGPEGARSVEIFPNSIEILHINSSSSVGSFEPR